MSRHGGSYVTFGSYCVNMADVKTRVNPLFLREELMHKDTELLFYAYSNFPSDPDAFHGKIGLGRAHHRVIYFVGRNPAITVTGLLSILRIPNKSLSRVLRELVRLGFV